MAGVVIIASAFFMVPVVGGQMDQALAARGLPPLSPMAMGFFTLSSLAHGLFLGWFYAAIRPRFGPGPRTAALTGLAVWVIAYGLPNLANVAYGFMPLKLTVIGTAWGLVELLTASLIGARLYREDG